MDNTTGATASGNNILETSNAQPFGEDYYLRGPERGLSNYTDYSWRPELTIPVCKLMMRYLRAQTNRERTREVPATGGYQSVRMPDSILDYGCARGYYVKALRSLGYEAWGYDVSEWAIENCDPASKAFLTTEITEITENGFDFILAKDVLEHIASEELGGVIELFIELTKEAALVIVPLSPENGGQRPEARYVSPVDNADATHKIAWTLDEWLSFIQGVIDESGRAFTISGSYRMPGVKRAAERWPRSCGFFLLKRFEYE
jgi:hypothetical protein